LVDQQPGEERVRAGKISILMAAAAAAAAAVTAVTGAIPASATATATVRPTAGRAAAGGAVAQARVLAGLESFSRTGSTAARSGAPAKRGGAGAAGAGHADRSASRGPALAGLDQCSTVDFDGDARLGPALLPLIGTVGREVAGYRRTGGLGAAPFLAKYYNSGSGSWIYPPDNGYVTGPGGQPEEGQLQLFAGQDIDRFGSVFGSFLAPAGVPYSARSIPPQSLDSTPAGGCNYHDYQVTKSFTVDAGPIAPWFGQPGGGTQFQLDGSLVPGAPAALNVMWLLSNGYLTDVPAS
jgi:hypothetical protein